MMGLLRVGGERGNNAVMRRAPPSDSADEDARLVSRMAAGDREAFAALYDRHAPLLMSLARKMLGSADEATDLLHDVFLEAWERASTYDPSRAPVRAWLSIRVRSRALDRKKSARVRHTLSLQDWDALPEGSLLHRAEGEPQAVRAALARVPSEVREVLELTYFAGLTAPEVAALLGIPVGTVKSRRARGLQALSQIFDERNRT